MNYSENLNDLIIFVKLCLNLKFILLRYKQGNFSEQNTIFIFTDIDELPRAEMILNFKFCEAPLPARFFSTMYYFNFEHVTQQRDNGG